MAVNIISEVSNILGKNSRILDICRLIEMAGKTDYTVLIQGEKGTGKELIANTIHAQSSRAKKTFIKVNCNASSETFLEMELFGHNKSSNLTGSYEKLKGEFELASGGTIFLDEICTISLSSQAKLLKALQNGAIVSGVSSTNIKADVRVISTSKIILKKSAQKGAFRQDLLNLLGVITIFLPPLRERKEDIPILVKNFIRFENFETERHIKGISPDAMDALMKYEWPGNVGELKNAIEHAVIIENSDTIKLRSLPFHILNNLSIHSFQGSEDFNLKRTLSTYERKLILRALIKADWVKSKAARLLGIDQRNLGYFIRKHHIFNS